VVRISEEESKVNHWPWKSRTLIKAYENRRKKLKQKFQPEGKEQSFFSADYFKSSIVLWLIVLSLVFNLADWIVLGIFIKPVDFPVILHYNVYSGRYDGRLQTCVHSSPYRPGHFFGQFFSLPIFLSQ